MGLCFTRRVGQSVWIGEGVLDRPIRVTLTEVTRGQGRLHVDAPGLVIRREELSPAAVDHLRQRAGTALRIPAAKAEGHRP